MSDPILQGVLEKRGWRKWADVTLQLTSINSLVILEKGKPKESIDLEAVDRLQSNQKGEEFAFQVHGSVSGKKDKWTLRAHNKEDLEKWMNSITKQLEDSGKGGAYNYGLPSSDPRTLLPLIQVPSEFVGNFGYLNMAVVHWFGSVKKLGTGFSVEERIAVLGDRCLYLCKKNADITRCVMISDIKKLLLAQDDAKDLYVAIIMPKHIEMEGEGEAKSTRSEYDIMFHCSDIQVFVKFLRTVYVYQTGGKNLALEQVRDKGQLEEEVRLTRPKDWVLTYWQPMFKEHLARLLDVWNQKQREGEGGAAAVSLGQPAQQQAHQAQRAESPAGPKSTSADMQSLEESPLGKFLVLLSLSKYFKVLSDNKMELSLMVSGLIDESDLEHFGVDSATDRQKIIEGLQDKPLVERLTGGQVSDSGLGFQPPKAVKAQLDDDFAGMKPKLAGDDDFDLDLGDPSPSSPKPAMGGKLDDFDLDLDDFGPMAAPAGGAAIQLDDLDDLDLGPSPSGGGGGLDLDDLDLGGPPAKPSGGGISLDDLDDLGPPASKPVGGVDLDDLDL